MTSDRLAALDVSFLHVEEPGIPLHVGAIATFEAAPLLDDHGELRLDDLRSEIAARLDLLPRLRCRVAWTPLGLARPTWVDDEAFDIANHVDTVHLPGLDDEALRRYAAGVMVELLPRDRPLWHLRFVTGLTGDRVALIERVHHALVDGVSGVDVATVLLDLDRDAPRRPRSTWTPEAPPSAAARFVDALRSRSTEQLGAIGASARALTRPSHLLRSTLDVARSLKTVVADGLVAPRSSLNRPIGSTRELAWVRTGLEDVKAAGREHRATANDVVLAAVAEGVRDLLLHRGEPLGRDATVKLLVPVSLRDVSARGTLGNQVGALVPRLPIGIGDPVERLRAISATTARLKRDREATTSGLLVKLADLVPAPAIGPIVTSVHRQRLVNLVVTNVPGSPVPLYAGGARMLEAFPVVPLAGNLTVGVAILSYVNALNLGITADRVTCPDLEVFRSGIERGFEELGVRTGQLLGAREGPGARASSQGHRMTFGPRTRPLGSGQ